MESLRDSDTEAKGRVRIRINRSNVLDFTIGPRLQKAIRRAEGNMDSRFCGYNPVKLCVFLLLGNILLSVMSTWILTSDDPIDTCNCDSSGAESSVVGSLSAGLNSGASVDAKILEKYQFSSAEKAQLDAALRWLARHGKSKQLVSVPRFMSEDLKKNMLPPGTNFSNLYWRFNLQISSYALYDASTTDDYQLVEDLLHELATAPIISMMSEPEAGTELKFWVDLPDGVRSIIKPVRLKREEELDPNLFYFSEKERHYAEIAAYHLDRILGYHHVPPCVGRTLSIKKDLLTLADDQFLDTVHYAPNGKLCFYGQCDYFCDVRHPICGDPDEVEFAFCVVIPNQIWKHQNIVSPWRRSYMKQKLATWLLAENNDTYCQKSVFTDSKYRSGRRLLDLIDLYIMDFFTGNQDRHSYNIFRNIGESGLISYDNGRGFGRSYRDDTTILAPLFQCCLLRKSTYEKLSFLHKNDKNITLSKLMRYSMNKDPLNARQPILAEKHLEALDRRLGMVMDTINRDCVVKKRLSLDKILIDDGY